YIVVGDAGSCLDLLPVAALLKERKIPVFWIADAGPRAQAGNILARHGIPCETRGPNLGDDPAVILLGYSNKAIDAQNMWTGWAMTRRAKGGPITPVLGYDDLFVNAIRPNVMGVEPDEILVISPLAERIVHGRRPDARITVVGKSLHIPDERERQEKRAALREKYKLGEDDFLVAFGFAEEPADHAVAQTAEILNERSRFHPATVFVFRFHPAHPQKKELAERMAASGLHSVDMNAEPLMDVYMASDAVVAGYGSTDAYRTVLMGIPTITMLFPDDLEYRMEIGYPNGTPPIVVGTIFDALWGVDTVSYLSSILRRIREMPELACARTQDRATSFHDLCTPDAAERIAAAVMKYF
ncbi:MAG: hypothetical protein WAP52_03950, partial [Candidatus Sungiibacteriota bacterium]